MDQAIADVLALYDARMREDMQKMKAAHDGQTSFNEVRDQVLLAVGPQTGRLINILAGSLKSPVILELGTSYGYSGIWLAEAARASGGRLITMEKAGYKSQYAREMSMKAGLAGYVDFQVGDAVQMIGDLPHGIDFVLVDLWKDLYVPCLEAFYPKLNPGAIIVADNMRQPDPVEAAKYQAAVRAKPKIASIPVPVGSGLEISRYDSA